MPLAVSLVDGLAKIHNAGVLHNDFPRNMLVVPGTRQGVWVDFSYICTNWTRGISWKWDVWRGWHCSRICKCITFQVVDFKLESRMKAEGRAEVYKGMLSLMPLRLRISLAAYLAGLFVEGLISLCRRFSSPPPPNAPLPGMWGINVPIVYFVPSGLLPVILHSYLSSRLARIGFQFIILAHQLSSSTLLWRAVIRQDWGIWSSWHGIGGVVLYYCAMREIEAFFLQISWGVLEKKN